MLRARQKSNARGFSTWHGLFAKLPLAALAFTLALGVACPMLHAAPVEFANFSLVNASQPFSFTNNGTSGTIGAINVPVRFDFTTQSGLPTGDHQATLTITNSPPFPPGTPSTSTPGFPLGSGLVDQPIGNLTTLGLTEVGTGKNLLTVLFTGDIVGRLNSPTASLSGTDTTGQVVTYTSDFGTVAQPGNSYNLGLGTISPALALGPGSFLESFNSNINGQFTGNFTPNPPTVPEPASLAMLGIGLTAVGVLWRAQRNRSDARPVAPRDGRVTLAGLAKRVI